VTLTANVTKHNSSCMYKMWMDRHGCVSQSTIKTALRRVCHLSRHLRRNVMKRDDTVDHVHCKIGLQLCTLSYLQACNTVYLAELCTSSWRQLLPYRCTQRCNMHNSQLCLFI